jgi:hypothetical protein
VPAHRVGVLVVGRAREGHHIQAPLDHVVHVQELAPRAAAAPDQHAGRAADLCQVKALDQRGHHVAVLQVVVVAGPVQVARHHAAVVDAVRGAVLPVVALAQLDARDLGDRVGLVGRLQLAGEQRVLADRLVRQPRVDAAGAQEQEPLHIGHERLVRDVGCDQQVLVDELRGVGHVGVDAADLGRGHVHLVDRSLAKKRATAAWSSRSSSARVRVTTSWPSPARRLVSVWPTIPR